MVYMSLRQGLSIFAVSEHGVGEALYHSGVMDIFGLRLSLRGDDAVLAERTEVLISRTGCLAWRCAFTTSLVIELALSNC